MSSAARTSNRVIAVTKSEADNSLDPTFKRDLDGASAAVTECKLRAFSPFFFFPALGQRSRNAEETVYISSEESAYNSATAECCI